MNTEEHGCECHWVWSFPFFSLNGKFKVVEWSTATHPKKNSVFNGTSPPSHPTKTRGKVARGHCCGGTTTWMICRHCVTFSFGRKKKKWRAIRSSRSFLFSCDVGIEGPFSSVFLLSWGLDMGQGISLVEKVGVVLKNTRLGLSDYFFEFFWDFYEVRGGPFTWWRCTW